MKQGKALLCRTPSFLIKSAHGAGRGEEPQQGRGGWHTGNGCRGSLSLQKLPGTFLSQIEIPAGTSVHLPHITSSGEGTCPCEPDIHLWQKRLTSSHTGKLIIPAPTPFNMQSQDFLNSGIRKKFQNSGYSFNDYFSVSSVIYFTIPSTNCTTIA